MKIKMQRSLRPFFFFRFLKPQGFTLIELMMVILLIGFLTTISFRSYSDLRSRQELDNALNHVTEMIKAARTDAISNTAVYDSDQPGKAIIPAEGYGIYFTITPKDDQSPHVVLFANTSINGPDINQFTASDLVLESYRLPNSVVFDKLFKLGPNDPVGPPDTGSDLGAQAMILFRPPLADAFVSNNQDPLQAGNWVATLSVQFSSRDESFRKKTITLNKVGGFPALHL